MTAPRDERAEREAELAEAQDRMARGVFRMGDAEIVGRGVGEQALRYAEVRDLPENGDWVGAMYAYRASVLAISRARLERVVEGLRENHETWCPFGKMAGAPCTCGANVHNAALDAVLTAMQGEG